MEQIEVLKSDVKVGTKILFVEEKQRYTVMARNDKFAVCTKPFNLQKTVLYTILDFVKDVRGRENLIFGMGAESKEQCQEMLERLTKKETEVSHRNEIPIRILRVDN